MSELILYRDGQAVDLNEHPSLLASLRASHRAMIEIDETIAEKRREIEDLEKRLDLHYGIGLETRGLAQSIAMRRKHIEQLQKRRAVHEKNYLELPAMPSDTLNTTTDWGVNLDTSVPLDVLRAMKHAKEAGIFDSFEIVQPVRRRGQSRRDPMIVGIVNENTRGRAIFYIASWR